MTDKEKIEVMQARVDGKQIQFRAIDCDNGWEDTDSPCWDWAIWEYRVKPEVKYRPFKDSAELVEWWEKHYQDKKRPEHTMPLVWVHFEDEDDLYNACFITEFWNDGVVVGNDYITTKWQELFDNFTFLDGKPCGVEE